MFPTGAEMKAKYNDAITKLLNELIETNARFGNMNADVTGRISQIGQDVEVILVDHGYEVVRYTDRYNVARNIIDWDNDINVDDISCSQLITSTKLRKSRMKELVLELIAKDFKYLTPRLNEFVHRNIQNPIVQDCVNTVCSYGYTYDKNTNQFTPI